MNPNIHKFKFLRYEYEWVDGAACMPYRVVIAHLICQSCGYNHTERILVSEGTCIDPSWPKPLPL